MESTTDNRLLVLLLCVLVDLHSGGCQSFVLLPEQYHHNQQQQRSNGWLSTTKMSFELSTKRVESRRRSRRPTAVVVLQQSLSSNRDDNDNNNDNLLEAERQRLESLLSKSSDNDSATRTTSTNSSAPDKMESLLTRPFRDWKLELKQNRGGSPLVLLTSMGRERLETEIQLLESLADTDEAIAPLWELWYQARGSQAYAKLQETEQLVALGAPVAWKKAEGLLRALVAKEGISYVEPINRLATLLFLQGRLEESLELCLLVLTLKPWHFGALSGIVLVYQGLNDREGMMKYAGQRMPPLPRNKEEERIIQQQILQSNNKRGAGGETVVETRQSWVDRMVDQAKAALLRGEMELEDSFRDLDGPSRSGDDSSQENDDVWQ